MLNELKRIRDLYTKEIINKERSKTSLYDYVANNYHEMSKEELKTLVLELSFAMYEKLDKEKFLEIELVAIVETIERIGE